MPDNIETLWRGTSSDERADGRRERLIDACYTIVGDEGGAALTVRAACRAANVGPRHFYEVFPDTDTLLLATYERSVHELQAAISAAVQQCSPPWQAHETRDRLWVVFDAATQHLEQNPRSGQLIFREALGNSVLRRRATTTLSAFVQPIRRLAFDDTDHEASAPYARLEASLLSGGLAAAFLDWLSEPGKTQRTDLVEYCTVAVLAVLTVKLPPSGR
jgi:AcrR family transcriptional regulator